MGAFILRLRQSNNMKPIRLFFLSAILLVLTAPIASARPVRLWSYQELLDASGLVVLATSVGTSDTQEHIDLPGFDGEHVIGIATAFHISVVLKGEKTLKNFVLHHYRTVDGTNVPHVPNGPTFVYFSPVEDERLYQQAYLLFLTREADGRYAPVVGQSDPGQGIRKLEGTYNNASDETRTKVANDLGKFFKECLTIKPGMTRAELCKVFSTEGGLSTNTHRTYVHRDCPNVKVDVDFTPSDPKQKEESPSDIVSRISAPYLAWSIMD
jgi:hypothetical protein